GGRRTCRGHRLLLPWTRASHHQALDELVLPDRGLLVAQLTCGALAVDFGDLVADPNRVVELFLGLALDLLGHGDGAAQRSQRETEESCDQPHRWPSTKSYGATGPVRRSRIRSCTASASPSSVSSNCLGVIRSMRNARWG